MHWTASACEAPGTLRLQDVYEEYERLRRGTGGGTYHAALAGANELRNRYSNVLPFDANRVRLQVALPARSSNALSTRPECQPHVVAHEGSVDFACMPYASSRSRRWEL